MPFYLGRKAIRKVPGTVIKAAPIPKPEITEGFGSREKAGQICKDAGFTSALLVTDETLFSLGLHEKVAQSLRDSGIKFGIFHSINSEPTVDIVEAGRQAAVNAPAGQRRRVFAVSGEMPLFLLLAEVEGEGKDILVVVPYAPEWQVFA